MVFLWEELGTGTLLGAMAVVKFNPLLVLAWMAVRPAGCKCWPNFLFLFLLKGSEASPGSSGYTLLLSPYLIQVCPFSVLESPHGSHLLLPMRPPCPYESHIICGLC